MKFLFPLPVNDAVRVTQTYKQHEARAAQMGACSHPGNNCTKFYFGGIDYGVPIGTPIYAAQDGTVIRATEDASGYGRHVRIQHDGYQTIYGHMSYLGVKPGDRVEAGDEIGKSGNTGNSSGPHLHFEVRKGNDPVDPASMLVFSKDALGNGGSTDPNPVPTDFDKLVFPQAYPRVRIATTTTLNIRDQASVGGHDSGDLFPGDVVELYGIAKDSQGNTWGKIGNDLWIALVYNNEAFVELVGG